MLLITCSHQANLTLIKLVNGRCMFTILNAEQESLDLEL